MADESIEIKFKRWRETRERIRQAYVNRINPTWTEEDEEQLNRDLVSIERLRYSIIKYGTFKQKQEVTFEERDEKRQQQEETYILRKEMLKILHKMGIEEQKIHEHIIIEAKDKDGLVKYYTGLTSFVSCHKCNTIDAKRALVYGEMVDGVTIKIVGLRNDKSGDKNICNASARVGGRHESVRKQ